MAQAAPDSGTAAAQTEDKAATPEKKTDKSNDDIIIRGAYVPTETTGSKVPTSILETPQSVSVITRDQIEVQNWTSLQQATRYTAGVNTEIYGADTRVDWLVLRGFSPVQYIDGLQAGFGGESNNNGLDLYGFESIEVLKGPSSGLYGSSPPGGIVNMTSRRPRDTFEGEVGVTFDSFGREELHGTVAGPVGGDFSYRLTGLVRNGGTQIEGENNKRAFLSGAVSWKPSDRTTFTPMYYYQNDRITNDGGGFLPANGTFLPSPNGVIPASRNLAEPAYNHFYRKQSGVGYELKQEFSSAVSFEQDLRYQFVDVDARYVYGGGLIDPPNGRIINRYNYVDVERSRSFNVDNRLVAKVDTGPLSHTLMVGLDYRRLHFVVDNAFDLGPPLDVFAPVYGAPVSEPPFYHSINLIQKQTGLYAQDQIRAGGLVLTIGLRNDWVKSDDRLAGTVANDSQLNYRAGINYVLPGGIAPYLSYSRSSEPVIGADFAGTLFKPTEGTQIEGGVKIQPRHLPSGVKVLVTAALFRLRQRNVLTPDPDPSHLNYSVQSGEVGLTGLELEGVARFNERLSINAAYTYTETKVLRANDSSLGMQLVQMPKHRASLVVDYTLRDGVLAGFGLGGGVRYQSASFGDPENLWRAAPVTLVDAAAHYEIGKWRLSLSVSNLFDKTYIAACSRVSSCYYGIARQGSLTLNRAF